MLPVCISGVSDRQLTPDRWQCCHHEDSGPERLRRLWGSVMKDMMTCASDAVPPRVSILSVGVSATHMEEALDHAEALIHMGGQGYICVTGVHGIMEAQTDTVLKSILNESYLSVPDGMPTVWVGRMYGHRHMCRVYGPDFMLRFCERSQTQGYRHFLFGGNLGVASDLQASLLERYPRLQIVGTYTPPFRPMTEAEWETFAHEVSAARPNILWVGLSTPKQERFMRLAIGRLDVNVMIGVGAAFDIHTGRLRDAPDWMKGSGLQWLHRLIQEPRRLARRYLVNNPLFLSKLSRQLLTDLLSGQMRRHRNTLT